MASSTPQTPRQQGILAECEACYLAASSAGYADLATQAKGIEANIFAAPALNSVTGAYEYFKATMFGGAQSDIEACAAAIAARNGGVNPLDQTTPPEVQQFVDKAGPAANAFANGNPVSAGAQQLGLTDALYSLGQKVQTAMLYAVLFLAALLIFYVYLRGRR